MSSKKLEERFGQKFNNSDSNIREAVHKVVSLSQRRLEIAGEILLTSISLFGSIRESICSETETPSGESINGLRQIVLHYRNVKLSTISQGPLHLRVRGLALLGVDEVQSVGGIR